VRFVCWPPLSKSRNQQVRTCGFCDVVISAELHSFGGSEQLGITSQNYSNTIRIYAAHRSDNVEAIRFTFDVQIAKQQVEILFCTFIYGFGDTAWERRAGAYL
jgi:hypothetical protein